MHQTYKYLAPEGKMIIRVPSMKHRITKEILPLVTLTFEEYRVVKMTSSSVGDETSYVCFKNKVYSRSASKFEKICFILMNKPIWQSWKTENDSEEIVSLNSFFLEIILTS
jgi:hypothetical protein